MIREKVLTKKNVLISIEFSVLFAIALVAPIANQQFVTGPLVNAALILATVLLGFENAVLIALFPSLIALSIGLLPPVLLPMIPFIITGNVLYIFIFSKLQKTNYWLGLIPASILKFALLFFSSQFLVNLISTKGLPSAVTLMMSWPQLVTALAGGIIAFGVLKIVKKKADHKDRLYKKI